MRIVTDIPELLEARSDPSVQRVLYALTALLGVAVVALQLLADAEPTLLAFVIGALMILAGAAGLVFQRMPTLRLDVGEGRIAIGNRSLWSRREQLLVAPDVRHVVLEESIDTDGTSSFRVVLVLNDGHRVPITTTYSPHYTRAAALATAVRTRLLPPAPPDPPPRGRIVAPAPGRGELWLTAAVLLFAAAFLGAGVRLASAEHLLLRHYLPVLATVVEVEPAVSGVSERGETARPSIRYVYDVDGITHVSSRVLPLDQWRDEALTREIVAQYAPGQRVKAFYDPVDPSTAYLLRRRSTLPLLFIALPLFGALLLSGGLPALRQ